MDKAAMANAEKFFTLLFLLFSARVELSALDFSILNRGDTIFQEILIETDLEEDNYFFNFGVTGLEPGARHNIHINTTEDIIFCSFYLFGISSENYVIENVAIEQNSIVYILPEHYQEEIDAYRDMDNPDAVYGAQFFDRTEYAFMDEESLENQYRTELEIFNYTNSPIFRIYCLNHQESKTGDSGDSEAALPPENLLKGDVLQPQESVTVDIVLMPDQEYLLQLKGAENIRYEEQLSGSETYDFLVFYDSNLVTEWENLSLEFVNNTPEELKEIYLIDQKSGNRVEILDGEILTPEGRIDYVLMKEILSCDIIIRTASNRRFYVFDWDLKDNPVIPIKEELMR